MKFVKQFKWQDMKFDNIPIRGLYIRRKKISFKLNSSGDQVVRFFNTEKNDTQNKSGGYKWLRRATREDFMYNGSFHEAIAPVLTIAQCFAVMPVKGLRATNADGLFFVWGSFTTFYSLSIFVGLLLYFGLTIYFVLASDSFRAVDMDPVIFYGSSFCAFCLFGNLARKWPALMRQWHNVEIQLPEFRSQLQRAKMANKIKMIALVVLVMSMIEHLLSIISNIHYVNYCNVGEEPYETFFRIHLYHIFSLTDFSIWKVIWAKLLNIVGTFVWSYMDIFVMMISVGLSEKFRQVNESLRRVKGKVVPEAFWYEHRMHYRNLCDLLEEIDGAISAITMISLSNNVYFICLQLLKSLNKMPSVAHCVYYWFSMAFLFGRTLVLSLHTSNIHEESKRPTEIFRCVPKESWCLEVKRFSQEVNSGTVALSGMRFFYLTRGLVLSVAGTVITYELVLFQFQIELGIHTECAHLLSIISDIHYVNYCKRGEETFFKLHLHHIFSVTDFSIWKAICVKLLNILGTFVWNYMDIFVMVISVGLSEKFRQVNENLYRVKGNVKRFSREVITGTVALSGMRFFYLTRGLVLSVAGTVISITYELVLFQFQIEFGLHSDC